MPRLENGQRLAPEMGTRRTTAIEREQKAQVRVVGLEQREPPEVVRAVPRHDAQPGVQQVVRFLDQCAVMGRHDLDRFSGRPLRSGPPLKPSR